MFPYQMLFLNVSTTFNCIWNCSFEHIPPDGVPVWEEKDSRGDAEAESEGAQSSHERTGQRENETGATGEEDHRWHKENGQTGTNGETKEVVLLRKDSFVQE